MKQIISLAISLIACISLHAQTNYSFENGFNGWKNSGLVTQTNSSFSLKQGNTYVEKWTSKGKAVGNAMVEQTVKNLQNGIYKLTVAAQNIQEGSSSKQTGAYIYADDSTAQVYNANNYHVTFAVLTNEVTIGFKAVNASGNWIAVDNFRLECQSTNITDIRSALQKLITHAIDLRNYMMESLVMKNLNEAIESTSKLITEPDDKNYKSPVSELQIAIKSAEESIKAFKELKDIIAEAKNKKEEIGGNGLEDITTAIEQAQETYESDGVTTENIIIQTQKLEKAIFAYLLANGTGSIPSVTTDTRYARGSNVIFGRSKVNGTNILEQGFCWSKNPEPTVLDNRTTDFISKNGKIYKIKGLTPSTKYYIRAYAITKSYQVGYGDIIKVYTIPKGNITYWYNNGGNAEENARINAALEEAVNVYWNNLTSIKGLNISCTYGAQTSTADCSYGGSMRIGPEPSYQQTGTVMHEMNHAIGGGTTPIWYGPSSLRAESSTGLWLGERANEILRFWENDNKAQVKGDETHFWPYGINGAHEDEHSEEQYTCTSLINQGLCEDGLIPVGYWSGGFSLPAYTFDVEDNQKYFIKNESADCGLNTSYLVMEGTKLVWKELTAEELTTNTNAAWYITYNPENCYYQFKNAGTEQYIKNGSNNNIHLMKGREDVTVGNGENALVTRGYWLIYASAHSALTAKENGSTTATTFDISNSAERQRWILLNEKEAKNTAGETLNDLKNELEEILSGIEKLTFTPHTSSDKNIDQYTLDSVASIRSNISDNSTAEEIKNFTLTARKLCKTYLSSVALSNIDNPFDITFLVKNHALATDSKGWSDSPKCNDGCCEFDATSFDFNQTIDNMPRGYYTFAVQAFQRPGTASKAYSNWEKGQNDVNATLYINIVNSTTQPTYVCHIAEGAQNEPLGEKESKVGNNLYVPNDYISASKYFEQGLYNCSITYRLFTAKLTLGICSPSASTSYWTAFSNIRLYFYGNTNPTEINSTLTDNISQKINDVPTYNLNGQEVLKNYKGITISGGKKFFRR